VTLTESLAVLFERLATPVATTACNVMLCPTNGIRVTVTVLLLPCPPAAKVPRSHVIGPVPLHPVPVVSVTGPRTNLPLNEMVRVAFVVSGPVLVTVKVSTNGAPMATGWTGEWAAAACTWTTCEVTLWLTTLDVLPAKLAAPP